MSIKDELEELGLSVAKAAEGLGVTRQQLHRLVNGQAGISPEMAYRLEQAIGSNADFWLRLQANYDCRSQAARRRDQGQKAHTRHRFLMTFCVVRHLHAWICPPSRSR